MNLNFINNIILPNWIEKYDEKIIKKIKSDAQTKGRILKKYKKMNYTLKRSIELSNSFFCKDFNNLQKLIFISNVIFPEDDQILNHMKTYGWTYDKIDELNNLIFKIKLCKKKNINIDFDISLLEEIKNFSKFHFGINNPAILINRLNELSVTKKDEIENIKTKKY